MVMVTTESESEQMNRAMDGSANVCVMKPFTKDVIAAKLAFLVLFGEE
jgi:two-component system, chemotaxis family, chemotaxis protein CheY